MGRGGYPAEFRRKVLDLVQAGRSVADVARDPDISTETIYAWRRQQRISQGLAPDPASTEKNQAGRRSPPVPPPRELQASSGRWRSHSSVATDRA
ncbi:transposase [Nocardiopsis deserti]|uniref:transposase n=1 Tax=Nocardiopsis deserti TaxID=2605988 RepID=UPI00168003E6|nr:transposase [Nocardiopsis deserti]